MVVVLVPVLPLVAVVVVVVVVAVVVGTARHIVYGRIHAAYRIWHNTCRKPDNVHP